MFDLFFDRNFASVFFLTDIRLIALIAISILISSVSNSQKTTDPQFLRIFNYVSITFVLWSNGISAILAPFIVNPKNNYEPIFWLSSGDFNSAVILFVVLVVAFVAFASIMIYPPEIKENYILFSHRGPKDFMIYLAASLLLRAVFIHGFLFLIYFASIEADYLANKLSEEQPSYWPSSLSPSESLRSYMSLVTVTIIIMPIIGCIFAFYAIRLWDKINSNLIAGYSRQELLDRIRRGRLKQ